MSDPNTGDAPAAKHRTVEIVVCVLVLIFGAIVVADSRRLGAGWATDGPQAGYFPFYIGCCILIAGVLNLLKALKHDKDEVFLSRTQAKLVLSVLAPLAVYVLAVQYLGLYVASIIYITAFMVWLGKYSITKSLLVAVGVMAVFFVMFEIWFTVPLLKGPLEALLGLA